MSSVKNTGLPSLPLVIFTFHRTAADHWVTKPNIAQLFLDSFYLNTRIPSFGAKNEAKDSSALKFAFEQRGFISIKFIFNSSDGIY